VVDGAQMIFFGAVAVAAKALYHDTAKANANVMASKCTLRKL
jgi:hypothetical protein